jgi:RHS repeat-associated protein
MAWVTDAATSTAFAPDGSTCWTSQTTVTSPTCASPPSTGGTTTTDYYDLTAHVVAQVGPGGSGVIGTSGHCNPTDALGTYSINTSDLCAFTTYSAYNEEGQLTEAIQPSLSSSTTGYVTAGATATYGYDVNGNLTSEVNPAGNTVTTTYDAANRKTGVSYSDSSNTMSYSYNVDGTRSQMVDSTGTTTHSYDNAGRLSSVTDSNGNTVTYGFNGFGQESCISYPGFTHDCTSSGAGTTSPPTGDVTRTYDAQGRLSSVVDWNGDAFTYAYDCTGDVAWMLETPNTQLPTVTPCQGSSGSVPTSPTPSSGTTYLLTSYNYSPGSSGNLLTSKTTSAVTSSGTTALLGFGSSSSNIAYDDNNNVMSVTPYKNGTAQATDTYATTSTPYDPQQRIPLSPEPSGWNTAYDYVNSSSTPFSSQKTVDQMGIDVQPAASSTYTGLEYSGNGQLCWEATAPTASTSSPCGPPTSPSSYESFSYNTSGDLTGTSASGFGTNSALTWNVDSSEPMCINPVGTSCSGPSSSQPSAATYTYDGDGRRMTAATWNTSSGSVVTKDFTWDETTSASLSNGGFNYLYGLSTNIPIAQIDGGSSVTADLITDPSSNIRAIVEVSSGATNPFILGNYTDYDAFGNPISASGGSTNPGGLNNLGMPGDGDSQSSFGFGGGYLDASGLVYLVHRYYDPLVGQFISVDSLLNQTNTPYTYAANDPVERQDPLGMNSVGFCLGAGGVAPWPGTPIASAGGFGQFCLARTTNTPTGNDDVGFYWSSGTERGTAAGAGLGGGPTFFVANSNYLGHLAGPFRYLSIQGIGSPVPGWSGNVAVFYSMPHGTIPFTFGVEFGMSFGFGASVGTWSEDSGVYVERNMWIANPLRWIWDVLDKGVVMPVGLVKPLLSTTFGQHVALVGGKRILCWLDHKTCRYKLNGLPS